MGLELAKSQRSEVASDRVMNRVDRIVAVVGVSCWTVFQAECVGVCMCMALCRSCGWGAGTYMIRSNHRR